MTSWLPGNALIELAVRGRLEHQIGWRILLNIGLVLPWRALGGCDPAWRDRLAEVGEDVANGRRIGDEGKDAHRTTALGAAGDHSSTLVLVTCYPFDAIDPGTALRHAAIARAE